MFRGSKVPENVEPPPEPPKNSKNAKKKPKNAPQGVEPLPEVPSSSKNAKKKPKNPPQGVEPLPEVPSSSKMAKKKPKNAPQGVEPPPDPPSSSKEAKKNPKNAPQEVEPPPEPPVSSKESKRNPKNAPQEVEPPPEPPSNSKARKFFKNAPEPEKVEPRPVSRVNHAGLYMATFYSNIGSFFFGISMGWTGGAERSVMEQSSYDFTPSEAQWDCVCMLLTLGAMTWCLPMGLLVRALGCRRTILVQLLPNTLGWCLTLWAQSIPMLYAGRFILGMCGGAHCLAVPIYSAEISPVKKRGIMGVCYHGAYMVGVIYSFVLCSVVDLRIVNIINLAMLVVGLLQILMPESPVYYVNRGNIPRAEATLRFLRGKDYDMHREMASLTREPSASDHDLRRCPLLGFKYKKARQSLGRTAVLGVIHMLSGALLFILFSYEVLRCQRLRYELIIALAVATVLGFLLCIFLVDRVGRRLLIIVSSAVTFFVSIILSLGLKLWLDNGGDVLPWINLASMTLFVGAYSAGLGALTWLLNVEMFAPPLRPLGCAISATLSWLTAFFALFWYSSHRSVCQPYLFLIFGIIAVLSLLFVLVYVPETMGLSPKRIQERMGGIMNRPTVVTFVHSSDESDA